MKTALACDFDNTLYFYKTEERFRAQDIFESPVTSCTRILSFP